MAASRSCRAMMSSSLASFTSPAFEPSPRFGGGGVVPMRARAIAPASLRPELVTYQKQFLQVHCPDRWFFVRLRVQRVYCRLNRLKPQPVLYPLRQPVAHHLPCHCRPVYFFRSQSPLEWIDAGLPVAIAACAGARQAVQPTVLTGITRLAAASA